MSEDLTALVGTIGTWIAIDFAQLITATFGKIETATGRDAVECEDGETLLPVHVTWLIVLCVLHRYSHRLDFGLPLNSIPEAELDLQDSERCLSGLSGLMKIDHGSNKIEFRLHPPTDIQRSPVDDMTLPNLILLYFGYISLPGGKFFTAKAPYPPYKSHSGKATYGSWREHRRANLILVNSQRDDHYNKKRFLRGLGIEVGEVSRLRLEGEISFHNHLEAMNSGTQDCISFKPKARAQGGRKHETTFRMRRSEVQWLVNAYLRFPHSPLGFLYKASEDFIVHYVLRGDKLAQSFQMLRKWLPALAASNEEIHRLNEALDAVTNDDTASLDWSRRAMQKFHELDLAITSIPDFNSWQL
ncbi:hypothetical protein SCUP234_02647 [Seiridium cupressi]